jgi:multiple sugar transport system permease protein
MGVLHLDPVKEDAGQVVMGDKGQPKYPELRSITRNNPAYPQYAGMRELFSFDWSGGGTYVLARDGSFCAPS